MSDQAETVVAKTEEADVETVAVEAVADDTVIVEETAAKEVAAIDAVVEEAVEEVSEEVATEDADSETSTTREEGKEVIVEAAADEAVAAEEAVEDVDTQEVVSEVSTKSEAEEKVVKETKSAPKASNDVSSASKEGEAKKRVVRVLSVGQEMTGTVKRISDFGAFVDIGVGRDGLLHVSELSVQRVGKVSDKLTKGQEITVWIKQLDRERNRISLTMISPDTKTIRDLKEGDLIEGTVMRMLPYGVFVDIGVGRDALLHVREMGEGYIKRPEDVVQMGEKIEARILSVSRRRNRIDLSIKGLRPEPEAEQPASSTKVEKEEEEEVFEDQFEEVEVLSAIELAFKKAMSGGESKSTNRKRKNRRRASRSALQDDIIARTLAKD